MGSTAVTKLLKLSRPHLFLIDNCTSMKQLKIFHAHFITNGLSRGTLFLSTLLSFTALSPAADLAYAHSLFKRIDTPNTFIFNTMIRGYAYNSSPIQALSMYADMLRSGLLPNNFTFPFVIKAASLISDHTYGEALHCSAVKFGHMLDLHVANSLLHMYASFGFCEEIGRVFDEIPEPDGVSWNVVIDDLAQNASFHEVLMAFNDMSQRGIEPNSVTLLGLLSACLRTGDPYVGKLIHLYIIKKDMYVPENLGNGLLDMYVKFRDMDSAEKLFARMHVKTVFSWTSMVDGYVQKGDMESAKSLFNQMPEKDTTAWNVILNGFIEAGDMTSAELIFNAIPERDLVSWNTMIVGYAQNKNCVKSLELFRELIVLGMKPDRITFVTVFSVCGLSGAMVLGEATHSCLEKQSIKGEQIEVALMDMYSKCGDSDKAMRVFDGMIEKSVLAWSAMIVGLAMNGLANEALKLFHQMQITGIEPNEITFIGLLCACSYAGLVEEGKRYFNAMSQIYGIKPRSEHFGCMADILGRAGLLREAESFIQNMPFKADPGIWGALLGACGMHGDVKMGEKVAKILTEMDPHHSGRHVLLSNLYAAENRWHDAEKARKKMKTFGVQKLPGFSLIELKGHMHQFLAGQIHLSR